VKGKCQQCVAKSSKSTFMSIKLYRRQLRESVARQILPCLSDSRQWQALLAEPPFLTPLNCAVNYHHGKPLSTSGISRAQTAIGHARVWPKADLHNTHAPYFGYVLEGEIDLRIGITKSAAEHLSMPYSKSDYAVISIPKHTFFVIPPGVPHGRGLNGHWERATKPQINTRIFWIHFFAPGIQCHESWYAAEGYISKGSYFLPDAHLLPAVEALIDEMRLREKSSPYIIHSLLSFIGHRVDRNLQNLMPEEVKSVMPKIHLNDMSSQITEQACKYIETHYQERISVEQIAAHCFVSASYLYRTFKATKKMTLNEYLTRTRLDFACTLLKETRLGIKQIGIIVGYPNRSHFCQIFTRTLHCSPSNYRKK
jgi:AraC-like DNA-binding protein